VSLDRTGLFIVRARREDGSEHPLRATIRMTADVAAGIEGEITASDIDGVCVELKAWLERFVGE